jgi:hypothetical protein
MDFLKKTYEKYETTIARYNFLFFQVIMVSVDVGTDIKQAHEHNM